MYPTKEKGWKKSSTIWFNILSAAVVLLESQHVIDLVPPEAAPIFTVAVTIINIGLRYFVTDSKLV